jgi:hypothetical protein
MIPNQNISVLRRCWQRLAPWLPGRLRKILRAALAVSTKPPYTLELQLDAILRELRRLHARIDALQEVREDPEQATPMLLPFRAWPVKEHAA